MKFHGETFDREIDYQRLKNNTQRVFALLVDGGWHKPDQLMTVGGARWSARVRSLREPQFGHMMIESRRVKDGLWEYKLDLKTVTSNAFRRIMEWDATCTPKRSKATDRECPLCSGRGRLPITGDTQIDMF